MSEKGEFTKGENKKEPLEVKAKTVKPGEIMSASTQIVPVTEFARPLVTVEQAKKAVETYNGLVNSLIETKDVVKVGDKQHIKKAGLNKISKWFGISCEIARVYKEDVIAKKDIWGAARGRRFVRIKAGEKGFIWRVWAKAIAPNGQFRVAGAACSSLERAFAHQAHDVYATAETRAKKRAIEELAGMGEFELHDDVREEEIPEPEKKPVKKTVKK